MVRSARFVLVGSTVVGALLLTSAIAMAQPGGEPPPPPPPPGPGAPPPGAAPDVEKDGARFRGGVSVVAGTMLLAGYSGFQAGVEGHLGVQLNNLLGIYAVPHFTLGPLTVKSGNFELTTLIGLASFTGVVDVTLMDHFYVGGGGGFGVVNNPSGPVVHFRAGGYPLMGKGEDGIRRKGLSVGLDSRLYFLSNEVDSLTVMELTAGVGYEAF